MSVISLHDPEGVRADPAARTAAFFCRHRPVKVDRTLLAELKGYAVDHDDADVRLCLHDTPEADHHDMVLVVHRENFYRPHKHTRKGETFQMIEGRLAVFAFDDSGHVIDASVLEPSDIYRVEVGMIHMIMPLTETAVFHENKPGPFDGAEESIFPPWAPDGTDAKTVAAFRRTLMARLLDGSSEGSAEAVA